MIEFVQGDIFAREADIRVNTVNCVGVMGAGVALAFKQRYPEMYREYKQACKDGTIRPGELHVWKSLTGDWIINFPTKRDWRDPSCYEDIEQGLDALRAYLLDKGPVTVSLPALGCGHGGLDWAVVSKVISSKLADLEAHILAFEPSASRDAGRLARAQPSADELALVGQLGFKTVPIDSRNAGDQVNSTPIYMKGDTKVVGRSWIAVVPSKNPDERERTALKAIASQMGSLESPITVAFVHSTKATEEIVHDFLGAGVQVVLIFPFGILTRKKLARTEVGNGSGRLTMLSATHPAEKWSKATFAEAMELLRSHASGTLISDAEPTWVVKKSPRKWQEQPVFYVRYDGLEASSREALRTVGAVPIGRKPDTGSPNLEGLWTAVGVGTSRSRETVNDPPLDRAGEFTAPHTVYVQLSLANLSVDNLSKVLREIERAGPKNVTLEVHISGQPHVQMLEMVLHQLALEARVGAIEVLPSRRARASESRQSH